MCAIGGESRTRTDRLDTTVVERKIDQSQINRFIVGTYVEAENYHKRPLSKLYTEIVRNIGLIGNT